jgi:hypothetical protein
MIKLEVHINFTSLYIIDETFFKRIMICKLVASISTNCHNYIFKNPKGENSNIFVPSTIRGFYFWLTKACTCTTMTTIQITSC